MRNNYVWVAKERKEPKTNPIGPKFKWKPIVVSSSHVLQGNVIKRVNKGNNVQERKSLSYQKQVTYIKEKRFSLEQPRLEE